MRFFIALEIPEPDRDQLKMVQNRLKELLPDIRPTENDKLHLTLAFIGEQEESLKDSLIKVLTDAASEIKPFSITPSYLDGFPNIHHPHTLWVGVKGDIDKLVIIRERIKDGVNALNIGIDERRFIPHIAIAKSNNRLKITHILEKSLQQMMEKLTFTPITISSIRLFESIPDEGFHTHNTLAEIKLS